MREGGGGFGNDEGGDRADGDNGRAMGARSCVACFRGGRSVVLRSVATSSSERVEVGAVFEDLGGVRSVLGKEVADHLLAVRSAEDSRVTNDLFETLKREPLW